MNSLHYKCKSRAQLAQEYGVSRRTLYSWFKKEKLSFEGKILKPIELQKVYKVFGFPEAEFMKQMN